MNTSAPAAKAPLALFDPWVWRMAWRDSRRSRGRLLVFSTALTLGVAALVAIDSVGWNLQRAITEQARTLVGADLIVESRHPLAPDAQKFVDGLPAVERAGETRLVSMATFPGKGKESQRLTQVRAIEGGYPFYGKAETQPPEAAAQMLVGEGAVVEESLALQFGLHPGDALTLGGETFRVLGTLKKLPGDVNVFAGLAPRVLIARGKLPPPLMARGSIVRYLTYLRLPTSVNPPALVGEHKAEFEQYRLDTDTVDHRKRQLGRVFDDVSHFLSLVSFVALLLGGIGVASAIQAHVKQKLRTVAVLRCLGASSGQTLAIYFLQAISLGIIGSLVGAAVGLVFQGLTPLFLRGVLPVELSFGVSWGSVAQGLVVGFVTCALFVLLPLLPVRRTPPLLALRAAFETGGEPRGNRRDPALWGAWALLAAALVAFPWVQSRNWQLGLGFSAALAVSFALLAGTARGLMAAARRFFPRTWPFEWRQGVGNLYRPNNRTLLLVFALGLSTFLLLGMYLTKDVLLRQFSAQGDSATQPNLIFFDIQPDQREPIAEAVRAHGMNVLDAAPAVTMRITSIDGKPVDQIAGDKAPAPDDGNRGRREGRWRLRHEYRSTYRDHLASTETIVGGEFRPRVGPEADGTDAAHATPVSVEEEMARELGLHVGTHILWDVQGLPVHTTVASLRKVDWSRFQSNFFVVFPAGVLEEAPAFNILVTRAPDPTASGQLQADVVSRYPGVSAIDLRLVVETVQGIVDKAATAVRFLSVFTVGTGLLVLAAAIFTGRYERVREGVLLRTLGASRRQIFRVLTVEYLALGTLAALTGIVLAVTGNWVLATFFFKLPWVPAPGAMVLTWAAVTALTVGVGLFASRGVCDAPPLEILRGEE